MTPTSQALPQYYVQTKNIQMYPGLELRAQPGLSSLPGSPFCLQLVLVLPDVIVLHSITTATWKAHKMHSYLMQCCTLSDSCSSTDLAGQQQLQLSE